MPLPRRIGLSLLTAVGFLPTGEGWAYEPKWWIDWRHAPADDGKLRRAIDQVTRGAQRAVTLTQQLLAVKQQCGTVDFVLFDAIPGKHVGTGDIRMESQSCILIDSRHPRSSPALTARACNAC